MAHIVLAEQPGGASPTTYPCGPSALTSPAGAHGGPERRCAPHLHPPTCSHDSILSGGINALCSEVGRFFKWPGVRHDSPPATPGSSPLRPAAVTAHIWPCTTHLKLLRSALTKSRRSPWGGCSKRGYRLVSS
jgi:hypothetical protein